MSPAPDSSPNPTGGPCSDSNPGSDFELVTLRNGRVGVRSRAYGEVCHPGVGPAEEAEALYVRGLDLPGRIEAHPGEFVVWDIGLGGGANAVAVLASVRRSRGHVRVVSFDHTLQNLAFALRHQTELGYFGEFAPAAEQLLQQGAVTWETPEGGVRWERVLGDFPTLLASGALRATPPPHAILFDPHSPKVNPEMWTLPLFRDLRNHLDPGQPCALATYSRSTSVRVALLLAGWWVGAGSTTGSKEQTTVAANGPELIAAPLDSTWLARARRSSAAEPWTQPPHQTLPLREATWEALQKHPQFSTQGFGSEAQRAIS